jgi:3-phosphoshikimate 1-carboxyvinyltransferase
MRHTVEPTNTPLRGTVTVPGDKSVSHRAVLFSAMAEGVSHASGVLDADDVRSSIEAVRQLGAVVDVVETPEGALDLTITGWGAEGPTAPDEAVDCGNSGTSARLLLGILAGWPGLTVTLAGDESLSRRPMRRVTDPLCEMGATFDSDGGRLPITVHGAALRAGSFHLPVASAQVKSAVMLAATRAEGLTEVYEPAASRNHTELMLPSYGVDVQVSEGEHGVRVVGPAVLRACDVVVPGDASSAAFLAVAAAIVPGSDVTITRVSMNPTRAGYIMALDRMGAPVEMTITGNAAHEPIGDLRVLGGRDLGPLEITGADVPSLVDELPILAVAAACGQGVSRFMGIGELRVKESDRLAAIADGLTALGVLVRDGDDWLEIHGRPGVRFRAAELESLGDHRLAMSWAVAALRADGPVAIDDFDAVSVSYPRFADDLAMLQAGGESTATEKVADGDVAGSDPAPDAGV